jgi:hypothetical protein
MAGMVAIMCLGPATKLSTLAPLSHKRQWVRSISLKPAQELLCFLHVDFERSILLSAGLLGVISLYMALDGGS